MAGYDTDDGELIVFAPPGEVVELSSDRLIDLQSVMYELLASGVSQEDLNNLIATLATETQETRTIPLPDLRPVIAVPESEVTSAWQDVIPQLAVAAGIALAAAIAAAFLISRYVTSRLSRVTRAAQEMSRGNYDQQLDPSGDDEIGRLARAFNEMARQVSRSHRTMRDLLANVSHELKTPLTSIQGFSQAMEEGAISKEEEYKQAGRIINEETQRMHRLVDDLIELSRLESGQAVMRSESVDLEQLLRACAERFEWRVRETGTDLNMELERTPAIPGDELRLEQAFSNLIDNAVRHAGGGAVTVRSAAKNGAVRIAVHNTGSYIPPEDLPRVFERFYQQERHRRREGGGSAGLGLAIAHEVVQAHHGKLEATSDKDTGTEFVVTLPVEGASKNEKAAPGRS
jgi:signal transduction histidine kinase